MDKSKNPNDIRKAGNAAMEEKDYEKAIKIYTDALLVSNILGNTAIEERGLLYSNRSYAYLKSAMESGDDNGAKLQLALKDANDVIRTRSTWWKGYYRAGLVYKWQKQWDRAIDSFNEALALNPDLMEVKKCRDECRFDKLQAEMGGNVVSHGFKEEIDMINEVHGTKLNADDIMENYEKLLKSADPKTRATACVFFGVRYVKGTDVPQDVKKGIDLLQEAVDSGSPEAMVELGVFYMSGKGVERNIKKAVALFERAANMDPKHKNYLGGEHDGITHAQFHIGLCFENGTGKLLDYYQARRWYEKASEKGHAGAANNMAVLYAKGLGGDKCAVRAKQFLRLSASRGNTTAMTSLAWMYLEEREPEQAESWYAKALECKNEHSIRNKDKFYKILKDLRHFVNEIKAHTSSSASSNSPASSDTNAIANLVEALHRATTHNQSIGGAKSIADSPVAHYWNNFEEIHRRAIDGHPFAQRVFTAMSYFAEGLKLFKRLNSTKISPADVIDTQEQCIHNLANSLRATEIITVFLPPELPRLLKICGTMISHRQSDLDLAARIVYTFLLSVSQSSETFSFSRICCQMYPDELFFYSMHAACLAVRQDFEASKKVCDEGLERFPKNEYLLYYKAGAMKMIASCSKQQKIAAFEEFIKYAPFDERSIPDAYYNMALLSEGNEQKTYYKKGVEAELKVLPCFLSFPSNVKSLADAMMDAFGTNDEKSGQPRVTTAVNEDTKSSEAASTLQLSNPARRHAVQRHRETLQRMWETKRASNFWAQLSIQPQKEQKMSKRPHDFTEITLRDMNPHKDEVYQKRFINLLIAEDPMFGLLSAIHVVVRDDNDDCINCSFYELRHFDQNVRQRLAFGSKITVLNPYYRLATDGSVALRVDDPKTIIYQVSGKDNRICRYCWKENPMHSCGNCKRVKYCGKSCQTDDWKILQHKVICGLTYFDGM